MTTHIGSFGEALLRAFTRFGEDPDPKARLARVADAAIRKHAPSLKKAADAVERAVRAEGGMMVEVLDELCFTRAIIERTVATRARRIKVALRGNGADQHFVDAHAKAARPDKHANAGQPAGGGHPTNDAHSRTAPATPAPPAARPGHARRTGAAMAGAAPATRRALLDTLRVNGQPLRDVTAGEALGFAEKSRTDAAAIERICTGLAEKVRVGDQITDAEAEDRMHERSTS